MEFKHSTRPKQPQWLKFHGRVEFKKFQRLKLHGRVEFNRQKIPSENPYFRGCFFVTCFDVIGCVAHENLRFKGPGSSRSQASVRPLTISQPVTWPRLYRLNLLKQCTVQDTTIEPLPQMSWATELLTELLQQPLIPKLFSLPGIPPQSLPGLSRFPGLLPNTFLFSRSFPEASFQSISPSPGLVTCDRPTQPIPPRGLLANSRPVASWQLGFVAVCCTLPDQGHLPCPSF